MDDNRVNILNESNRILSKLQILAAFFSDEIVYKIYLRSQVIHQLFENNAEELDINKLELFHIQFTDTVVELLKKIKKNNEKNVSLLFDEIDLNQDTINKLEAQTFTEAEFNLQKQRQALRVNSSLRKLYEVLSNNSSEYPFAKNINSFSAQFGPGFYKPLATKVLMKLIAYTPAEVYTNAHAVIQRKLMGLLCKYDFRSEFYCGLTAGSLIVEVYKITEPGIYFVFYPSQNLFLLCDAQEMEQINATVADAKPTGILHELRNKNDQLKSTIVVTKTYMPAEVRNLLGEHYKKISDINFLKNISDFDVQANILKTMLNTDMM